MKNILLITLICVCTVLNGQDIVHIPNEAFKLALIDRGVDDNGDSEIQVSEALDTKYLSFKNYSFKNMIGISDFKNLIELEIEHNEQLEAISLTDLPKLEELIVLYSDNLELVELNQVPVIDEIKIFFCDKIIDINLNDISSLEKVNITGNKLLSNIYLNNISKLKSVDIRSNHNLVNFSMTGSDNIEYLYLNNFLIDNIDLANKNNLEEIHFWGNLGGLENQVFDSLPSLKKLFISYTNCCESIDFGLFPKLKDLVLINIDTIDQIDLSNHSNIKTVKLESMNNLRHFSLTDNPSLESFAVKWSTDLEDVNLINLNNLQIAYIHGPSIRDINLTNAENLNTLHLSGINIKELQLTNLPSLNELSLLGTEDLEILDLSQFSQLSRFTIENNSALEEFYCKTGNDLVYAYFRNNNNIEYICTNEIDIPGFINQIESDDLEGVTIDSECTTSVKTTPSLNVAIYPTIIENIVSIQNLNNINEIIVFNQVGLELLSLDVLNSSENLMLDLGSFNPGMYFIKFKGKKEALIKRIIKI